MVGLRFRPAYGTCVISCALRLPPAVSGSGVRCGRVCWAWVSAVPRPSWLGCRGVFFALFFWLCGVGCWVSLSRALWSLSPHPLSFGLGCWLLFFSWCVSACFGVPFPSRPLFLAWCCRFWLGGLPVPLWGSCLRCPLGAGFGRLWWCWRAVWWLWAVFAPPPSPLRFFLGGGPACSSRTGPHSVWSSGLLLAVAFCLAVFRPHGSDRLCTRWAWRPFLPGYVLALPAGRLRQAAACGSGLGGWGCSCPFPSAVPVLTFWVIRHRCCRAHGGPVCGLRCRCVACWCGAFRGVRWLASVSPSG